jgi:hypothetical protein
MPAMQVPDLVWCFAIHTVPTGLRVDLLLSGSSSITLRVAVSYLG